MPEFLGVHMMDWPAAGSGNRPLFDAVVALYCRVWADPPFTPTLPPRRLPEPEEVAARLKRHAGYPGFRGLVAVQSYQVVGFTYGYTSLPGQFYHEKLAAFLGPAETDRWLSDCFEYVELAVDPLARRRGLGRRLLTSLLEGLPHQTAVLTTQVANQPARSLYERDGWQVIRADFLPDPAGEPYVIMGAELPLRAPASSL